MSTRAAAKTRTNVIVFQTHPSVASQVGIPGCYRFNISGGGTRAVYPVDERVTDSHNFPSVLVTVRAASSGTLGLVVVFTAVCRRWHVQDKINIRVFEPF